MRNPLFSPDWRTRTNPTYPCEFQMGRKLHPSQCKPKVNELKPGQTRPEGMNTANPGIPGQC